MTDDSKDWITVAALPQLGASSIKTLWEAGWTPTRILNASPVEWQRLGFKKATIAELTALAAKQPCATQTRIDSVDQWLALTDHAQVLAITHEDYPALLREISDPPPVLFIQGNPTVLSLPQIAIVGSRHASTSGIKHAQGFASFLGANGLVITSGLALGIDAAAHQGCINAQGITVAVMGTGIDKIYPKRNIQLAQSIIEQGGVLVSEFFPTTPPLQANFPKRNRIISGMSMGVVVVEAALKSGSLITARMAMEQNRHVFALPGSIHNPMSKGCHQLIKEGAYLVEEGKDIVSKLSDFLAVFSESLMQEGTSTQKRLKVAYSEPEPLSSAQGPNKRLPETEMNGLTSTEAHLLTALGYEPMNMDELIHTSGMSSAQVAELIICLELKGVVLRNGNHYQRC